MTTAQEDRITELNNTWGVATWREVADGALLITLDDGDECIVREDGTYEQADWLVDP